MPGSRGLKFNNPVNLNKKVPELPRSSAFDPVSRAEQAMEKLAKTFEHWMLDELKRLNAIWDGMRDKTPTEETVAALYSVAHDLKGEAATFGFPLVGEVSNSLCRLLDAYDGDTARVPLKLADQHVLAIRAIVKERAQNATDPVGRQIVDELNALTMEIEQTRQRPERAN